MGKGKAVVKKVLDKAEDVVLGKTEKDVQSVEQGTQGGAK